VAGLEKALADTISGVGYKVLNKVECQKPPDPIRFARMIAAFAEELER
jgi:hypothetical protein